MKKTTFLIAGKHAVTEALKNPIRRVSKVFLTEDSKKTLNRENPNIIKDEISKLDPKKASVENDIPTKMLIDSQDIVCDHLSNIYNNSKNDHK